MELSKIFYRENFYNKIIRYEKFDISSRNIWKKPERDTIPPNYYFNLNLYLYYLKKPFSIFSDFSRKDLSHWGNFFVDFYYFCKNYYATKKTQIQHWRKQFHHIQFRHINLRNFRNLIFCILKNRTRDPSDIDKYFVGVLWIFLGFGLFWGFKGI
jgi:hypothetical protein